MRALSDALPAGHRAMVYSTRQLHFGLGIADLLPLGRLATPTTYHPG